MRLSLPLLLLVAVVGFSNTAYSEDVTVRVGSKNFTESIILGDILTLLFENAGVKTEHVRQLGGTRILWNALLSGKIDAYPEYSGTLSHEILAGEGLNTSEKLRAALAAKGIVMGEPLGFNNTYAIGLKKKQAAALKIATISDLVRHPDLRLGFSNEFMDRAEGWPGLRKRYHLPQNNVHGMSHDLAYRGLESGAIDVTDLYSTDAEIAHYDLAVLGDNANFFPRYDAVILYRQDLITKQPALAESLAKLAGSIVEENMVAMNARAKIERVPEAKVASEFVNRVFKTSTEVVQATFASRLLIYTKEHLELVAISLGGAILLSIPLGITAAKFPAFGYGIMAVVGIIQTIPSLALLVFMIPLVGIGSGPAIIALFLYSLLPIVRSTHQGFVEIPAALRESALVLGLPGWARLKRIELPLASGAILSGIKTSAVINIGTATLGALVGAGGYGQPILTGIRLDSVPLILLGAVPAAIMALTAQFAFEFLETRWVRAIKSR